MTPEQIIGQMAIGVVALLACVVISYEVYVAIWKMRRRRRDIEAVHKANASTASVPESMPCVDCPWPDWGCCRKDHR